MHRLLLNRRIDKLTTHVEKTPEVLVILDHYTSPRRQGTHFRTLVEGARRNFAQYLWAQDHLHLAPPARVQRPVFGRLFWHPRMYPFARLIILGEGVLILYV